MVDGLYKAGKDAGRWTVGNHLKSLFISTFICRCPCISISHMEFHFAHLISWIQSHKYKKLSNITNLNTLYILISNIISGVSSFVTKDQLFGWSPKRALLLSSFVVQYAVWKLGTSIDENGSNVLQVCQHEEALHVFPHHCWRFELWLLRSQGLPPSISTTLGSGCCCRGALLMTCEKKDANLRSWRKRLMTGGFF